MKLYSGTVRFSPLEGGFWQLVASDGRTYQLVGRIRGLKDGEAIQVEGKIQDKRLSFAMTGPILEVSRVLRS